MEEIKPELKPEEHTEHDHLYKCSSCGYESKVEGDCPHCKMKMEFHCKECEVMEERK